MEQNDKAFDVLESLLEQFKAGIKCIDLTVKGTPVTLELESNLDNFDIEELIYDGREGPVIRGANTFISSGEGEKKIWDIIVPDKLWNRTELWGIVCEFAVLHI